MERGKNVYSRFDGLPELRQAIAKKLAQYNGIVADPETDVTVSAGATGSFHCACLALLNPGDEFVLFEPYYQYHISALLAVEAVSVTMKMQAPDGMFSTAYIERAITPRTKAIIVNSPGNPSGKVFSRQELESIAAIVQQYELFVVTDEIYEYFLYDGRTQVSLATLPGMADRTITIGGLLQNIQYHRLAHRLQCRSSAVGRGDWSYERPALCLCPDAVAGGGGGGHPGTSRLVLPRSGARI